MSAQSKAFDAEVAIIGAGPTGLSLAIELGIRGTSCLLFERNDRVGYAPRAKTTNVRTRTHLRRWGIADRLADEAPFGVDYPSNVHFVTRLSGKRLAMIENASNCAPARSEDYPEQGQWIPQYKLEEVLRQRAEELSPASLHFNCEFLRAEQDEDGVTVHVSDNGRERRVRVRYLVGADGARSQVRELIGATMSGKYGLSRNYNVVFRAPGLAAAHGHGPGTMYWQVNPDSPSLVGPMDKDDVWFFMPTRVPEGFDINGSGVAEFIRASIGIDVPVEVLSCDEWVASSLIADRYRDRRIFLAGDACHLHPPFGGYGMNMGVADGVDLGWKLAAVSAGWGGPLLLASYEVERRKIHLEVLEEASANHAILANDLWNADLDRDDAIGERARAAAEGVIRAAKEREFHTLGTVLGGQYAGSGVIIEDDTPPLHSETSVYRPTSDPGSLAPHFWLSTSSIYDHFGSGFALLCSPTADTASVVSAVREAEELGLPLRILVVSGAGLGRYPHDLTLVRPDQYICWRGKSWDSGLLEKVTGWRSKETSPGAALKTVAAS